MFKLAQTLVNKMDKGLNTFNNFNKSEGEAKLFSNIQNMSKNISTSPPKPATVDSKGLPNFKYLGDISEINKGLGVGKGKLYSMSLNGQEFKGQKIFLESLWKANQDYRKDFGKDFYISKSSGKIGTFRSYAEQLDAYQRGKKYGFAAAHPNYGYHPWGLAADLGGDNGDWKNYAKYLKKYNIQIGHVRNDGHHAEYIGPRQVYA